MRTAAILLANRCTIGGLAAAILTALAMPSVSYAGDTLTGQVVDLTCYLRAPSVKGPDHQKCASTCARKCPIGIVTSDGKVVLLLEDHDSPKPYAEAIAKVTQTIEVEGDAVTQGGFPGIVVEEVK